MSSYEAILMNLTCKLAPLLTPEQFMEAMGLVKDLNLSVKEKANENIHGLASHLKNGLPKIAKFDPEFTSMTRDHLIYTNLIKPGEMPLEPVILTQVSNPISNPKGKGKEKEPQGPAMVCGCITKDKKKPCQRRGVAEYGGRCGHHKNSEGPRVTSVETLVDPPAPPEPADPKSASMTSMIPEPSDPPAPPAPAEPKSESMAPMDPGPSEPPVPMTTTKAKVKTAPAEVEEDPEEVERRQADFTEEERQMVADMTRQLGMTGDDGEVLHEELEEWDPFEGEGDEDEDEDEDAESDEVDYE
jgi:hypothetical protein